MYSLKMIDDFEDASAFTALGNDTTNLAASSVRMTGSYSLELDKADGAAGKVYAGAYRTIALDLTSEMVMPHDMIAMELYVSATTDVATGYIKLGSSATNNLEWQFVDTGLQAGWNLCNAVIGDALLNGTGWNPAAITYLEVGVNLDAQDDTLADIKFDSAFIAPANFTRT